MIKINKKIRDAIKDDPNVGKIIKKYNNFIKENGCNPNYIVCKLMDIYPEPMTSKSIPYEYIISFAEPNNVADKYGVMYMDEDSFIQMLIDPVNYGSDFILDILDFKMELD